MPSHSPKRSLNVLVALTDPASLKFGCSIVARLQRVEHVSLKVIACYDLPSTLHFNVPLSLESVWHRYDVEDTVKSEGHHAYHDSKVAEYCSWVRLVAPP
jgi:hypothetical protein